MQQCQKKIYFSLNGATLGMALACAGQYFGAKAYSALFLVCACSKSTWEFNENAAFPPLVFLQLLFGYRSLDDLRYAFPDVKAKDESELVLNVLFPARPSWALPIG